MDGTWVKLMRSDELLEMLHNLNAFGLLTLIAIRARRTGAFNHLNLSVGQAVVGDFESLGITRQQYRTALSKLVEWGFITTKATTKGTIATIIDKRIYDINADDSNQQPNQTATIKQPTANQRATTNKNVKKEKNANNEKEKEVFDIFRKSYPGRKYGLEPEWENFTKKHDRWREFLPLLKPAVENQVAARKKVKRGEFIPSWKNLQTWINQSGWTEECGNGEVAKKETCDMCGQMWVSTHKNGKYCRPHLIEIRGW